jgi:hypothetical protein
MQRAVKRALAVAAIVFAPVSVHAAGDCPGKEGPWIRVESAALPAALQANLLLQLRSALARRGLTACENGDHPLATIVLTPYEGVDVRITLSIRDEVTNKLVERTVKLGDLPADARALALAQMTDELLRASWAELTVEDAPPPPIAVPPEVHDALPKRSPRTVQIDVAFVLDHFTQNHDQLGVDAALHLWLASRFGVSLRAGPRGALVRGVGPGSISGNGFFAGIGPRLGLVRLPRFGVDLEADVAMLYVGLGGRAGAASRSADGLAVLLMATASAWMRIAPPLRAFVEIGGGGAARGVRVTDGTTDLGGPAGFLVSMRAGVGTDL